MDENDIQSKVDDLVRRIKIIKLKMFVGANQDKDNLKAYETLKSVYELFYRRPDDPTLGVLEGCVESMEELLSRPPSQAGEG